MRQIFLLDCTLRDGGYINNWEFGEKAIKDVAYKMSNTGVEYFEIGFIKETEYQKIKSVFSSNEQIAEMIQPKNKNTKYVGMVDIGDPIPLSELGIRRENSIDVLRVIFKKDHIEEGYQYCKEAKKLGYEVFAQIVATNSYSDKELVDVIEKFNPIIPEAVYVVDTLGVIKRKDFLRMVQIMDHNLSPGIILGYHSHNNMQQAFGNAEALVELNLRRDIIIDACVFGMGRGAGNLNMELFAGYLNEGHDKNYRVEPMLEIIDEYLNDIYSKEFWGYSLPYYLSASNMCHPNYAKYFAEKGTLSLKAFNEILRTIPADKKENYEKSVAEVTYQNYQSNYIDDMETVEVLRNVLAGREILLLGPGTSIEENRNQINKYIELNHPIVIALNFVPDQIHADYVFSSHIRRYSKIEKQQGVHLIVTSNIREAEAFEHRINYASYASKEPELMDNSGITFLNFLISIGTQSVKLAGMDGYESDRNRNYVNSGLEHYFDDNTIAQRNALIRKEFLELRKYISIEFITKSKYEQE